MSGRVLRPQRVKPSFDGMKLGRELELDGIQSETRPLDVDGIYTQHP